MNLFISQILLAPGSPWLHIAYWYFFSEKVNNILKNWRQSRIRKLDPDLEAEYESHIWEQEPESGTAYGSRTRKPKPDPKPEKDKMDVHDDQGDVNDDKKIVDKD